MAPGREPGEDGKKMTEKDEFIKEFEQANGKKPQAFKGAAPDFARALNEAPPKVRELFRAAVQEAMPSAQDEAAAGLANLFGTPDPTP